MSLRDFAVDIILIRKNSFSVTFDTLICMLTRATPFQGLLLERINTSLRDFAVNIILIRKNSFSVTFDTLICMLTRAILFQGLLQVFT